MKNLILKTAAFQIDGDVAAIKAVAEVESAGNGFLADGRAKILFEGHIFYKYTNGELKDSHPDVERISLRSSAHLSRGALIEAVFRFG